MHCGASGDLLYVHVFFGAVLLEADRLRGFARMRILEQGILDSFASGWRTFSTLPKLLEPFEKSIDEVLLAHHSTCALSCALQSSFRGVEMLA